MTESEALIVRLSPRVKPLLNSLAMDSPSSETDVQIYFCLARLKVLMSGVTTMLESDSVDVRSKGHELIDALARFTAEVELAESLKDWFEA